MVSGFNDIGVYWSEDLMLSLCGGDQIKREDEKSVGRWQFRGKTREQGEDDRSWRKMTDLGGRRENRGKMTDQEEDE